MEEIVTQPASWYARHGIILHVGDPVTAIDPVQISSAVWLEQAVRSTAASPLTIALSQSAAKRRLSPTVGHCTSQTWLVQPCTLKALVLYALSGGSSLRPRAMR